MNDAHEPSPLSIPRRTIAQPVTITGVTLFTAVTVSLTLRPAPAGHGIVFRRTDLPDQPRIPASTVRVVPESRHTVLSTDPQDRAAPVVHTSEHILSAAAGLGITDLLLDLHGPEAPIGDGSAALFTEALLEARPTDFPEVQGHAPQNGAPHAPRQAVLTIAEPITVSESTGAARIEALPPPPGSEPALELEYRLDYGAGSPIAPQVAYLRLPLGGPAPTTAHPYVREIAPARTFCLFHEAQAMRKMGLFKHLDPKDMLVIGEKGEPIDNALRYPDEPARHKLLDLLGDLWLAGRPIAGRIIATRSGHALNHELARALLAAAARPVPPALPPAPTAAAR